MSKRMTHQEICEEWESVSRAQNLDHRRGTEAAIRQCRQFLAAIQQQADVEQARYRYLAQRLCDHFWSHNVAHRTDQTPGYPGHFGCRVRLRKRKLELSWYYNRFVPKKGSEGRSVFSEYIRKEGQYRYHKPAFTRAQDWEQPLIMETETGFEMLRRLNANQAELCRIVRKSERLLKDLEDHLRGLKEATSVSSSRSSEER
ncbi:MULTISPECIES: conjugative transfer protein MobI(A/C) [unclassified Marinobacter]|uniref:conjugative transfer protein MobI(A/C) n=1 Tax=unclassified Marinobacter TaxID=83889 RepID=UPI0004AF6DFB|nr:MULTISPECIES: conjugative transfer protein MobI(A/C) [unclassified Marinobacter]|tara:strand:- start:73588 stop:74190 length:603 start_codon:yes stop_codon:yes gene_type:complete